MKDKWQIAFQEGRAEAFRQFLSLFKSPPLEMNKAEKDGWNDAMDYMRAELRKLK